MSDSRIVKVILDYITSSFPFDHKERYDLLAKASKFASPIEELNVDLFHASEDFTIPGESFLSASTSTGVENYSRNLGADFIIRKVRAGEAKGYIHIPDFLKKPYVLDVIKRYDMRKAIESVYWRILQENEYIVFFDNENRDWILSNKEVSLD